MTEVPTASTFTAAPLRNRVRVELSAPVSDVWPLIGDLTKFPEYSAGLERVDVKADSGGRPIEYVCHFKPLEEGADRIVSREIIRWLEPHRGYASSGVEGDAFGLMNDLHLVVLEPSKNGVVVTWNEYFDAADVDVMKAHFDDALADASKNLVRRFGAGSSNATWKNDREGRTAAHRSA